MNTLFKYVYQTVWLIYTSLSWNTCDGQTQTTNIFTLSGCISSGGIWYVLPASIGQCMDTCIRHSNCLSVNYNRRSALCILRDSDVAPLTDGFCYHVILNEQRHLQDLNLTGILRPSDPCSARPCDNQSVCESSTTPEIFVCRLVYCDNTKLPTVPNALIRSSDTTKINSTNAYACIPGYTLFGDSRIRCEADGNWSAVGLTCFKDCSPSIQRVGATVQGWTGMRFCYNTTVTFSCMSGYYSLIPKSTSMTCRDDGTWTPFQCYKYCLREDIPIVENGKPTSGTIFTMNEKVTFTCKNGYYMSQMSTSIVCQSDGTWEIPSATCQMYCPVPVAPINSILVGPLLAQYKVDMKASFICSPSSDYYTNEADVSVTCQTDGTWTAVTFTCNRYCGQLLEQHYYHDRLVPTIMSGGDLTRYTTSHIVYYRCTAPAYTYGDNRRWCGATGSWSDPITCCREGSNGIVCCKAGQCWSQSR